MNAAKWCKSSPNPETNINYLSWFSEHDNVLLNPAPVLATEASEPSTRQTEGAVHSARAGGGPLALMTVAALL